MLKAYVHEWINKYENSYIYIYMLISQNLIFRLKIDTNLHINNFLKFCNSNNNFFQLVP